MFFTPPPINNVSERELEQWIEATARGELLPQTSLLRLCDLAKEVLLQESHLVQVKSPVTVCGRINGQFHDLLEIFRIGGWVPDTNYLFLGGYINRGEFSVEVLSLLLCLKVRYPDRIHLLRGCYETRNTSKISLFYDECLRKFESLLIYRAFLDLFDHLPLTALIDEKVFCVHGGLSPLIDNLEDILNIERVEEVPYEGGAVDLLWDHPEDRLGWNMSRVGSYTFGKDISDAFISRNNLEFIVTASQLVMNGFEWTHGTSVATLFSGPNYLNRCENKGAFLQVDAHLNCNFVQFDSAPRTGHIVRARKMNL